MTTPPDPYRLRGILAVIATRLEGLAEYTRDLIRTAVDKERARQLRERIAELNDHCDALEAEIRGVVEERRGAR